MKGVGKPLPPPYGHEQVQYIREAWERDTLHHLCDQPKLVSHLTTSVGRLLATLAQVEAERDALRMEAAGLHEELAEALGTPVDAEWVDLTDRVRALMGDSGRLLATLAQVEAERDALRDAAEALVTALETTSVRPCESCDAIATMVLEWDEESLISCDHYAREQLASDDPPPIHVRDLPVAAPLRALRTLIGGAK